MMEKKLYRSTNQQVIAGVCGGLGEYFDIDVTLIRLGWAALFFLGGSGLILYIIAAIVIPKKPYRQDAVIVDVEGQETVKSNNQENNNQESNYQQSNYQDSNYQDSNYQQSSNSTSSAVVIIGLIMIGYGALVIMSRVMPFNIIKLMRGMSWPLILIIVGAALMYSAFRRK